MKKILSVALVAALAGGSLAAQAYEKGDMIIRLGATTVDPDADSDAINLPGVPTLRADVEDDTQLGIIPAWMITDKIGLELLAATPFEHDISVGGKGVGDIDAGSTKHLPPTLSLQFYPLGGNSGWQPYVGVGVNWTYFFDEDVDGELKDALGAILGAEKASLSLSDSWGLSAQAGVDIPLGNQWGINLAVWYIDISTEAKLKTDVGTVKFDVDIDPWVYNIGVFYRF
ncbi:MAG: OmpW family outer membrane protein [Halioglobus sp.]|jgi:outer membrane protein